VRSASTSRRPFTSLRFPPLVSRARRHHFHPPARRRDWRATVQLLPLARGEIPRARPRYGFRPHPTVQHARLSARRARDSFACLALAGPPERAGLRIVQSTAHSASLCFLPSSVTAGRPADSLFQDRQPDRSSVRQPTHSFFHRLPNKPLKQTAAPRRDRRRRASRPW